MSRRKAHIRALIGALAVAAFAAPAAQAIPADMHTSVAQPAAVKKQDLGSPDARDAAVQSLRGSVATAAAKAQDLRSPDARDAAVVRPITGATPVNTQPVAPKSVVTDNGSDIDWATIGIGVLLSLVAVGGFAALAARRSPRMRIGA